VNNTIYNDDRRATLPLVSSKQIIDNKGMTQTIRQVPYQGPTIRPPSSLSSNQHIVFNNNLRSSRIIGDNNSTVRPVSRSNSR